MIDDDQRQERTTVPPEFFDALLRSLDEPPVRDQRTSDAAEDARRLLIRGADQ
jgi:hypothetical protein